MIRPLNYKERLIEAVSSAGRIDNLCMLEKVAEAGSFNYNLIKSLSEEQMETAQTSEYQ